MRNNNFHLSTTGFLTVFLFLFLLPINVFPAELFHTIQTSSFSSVSDAQKQFDAIVNKLDETQLDNLRIEKIGKFYTVRLGKFMDNTSAENFFGKVKSKLPNANIMTAYIKKKRIVKIYSASVSVNIKEPESSSSTALHPDKIKSQPIKKADKIASAVPRKKDAGKIKEVDRIKTDTQTSNRQIQAKKIPAVNDKSDNTESDVPLKENLKNIENLVRKAEYAAALDIIKAETTVHPEHPDLNAWFGMVLLKMDNPLEAQEYLEKATKLSPKIPDYHNGLGYSLFFLDRYDEAIVEFNKTISLDPGHFDALTGLCIAYAKNENKDKAMDIYHRIKYIDEETSKKLLKIIKK